jgi:ABC-type uncharacterized transport system ATPase subunit
MNQSFVELSKVSLPEDGTSTWSPISFTVNYGEIACFSDSGSRGFTVLSYIAGLKIPAEGAIVIDGQLIQDTSSRPLLIRGGRRFSNMQTPREYLQLFVTNNCEEFLGSLRASYLVPRLDQPLKELAYSLRQELEIVMGIASGATCLLLHRPFEGIDDGERKRLHFLLEQYVSKGCAVIYTASYLSLHKFAGKVVGYEQKEDITPGGKDSGKVNEKVVKDDASMEGSKGVLRGIQIVSEAMGSEFLSYLEGRVRFTGRLGEAIFNPTEEFGGLLPRLTIEEHFAYYFSDMALIELGHVHRKRVRGCTLEIFESYGLRGIAPCLYPEELSHYNCIVINLMIQLSRLPEVLYAWFPLGGVFSTLLPSQREQISELLRRYVSSGGRCVIFSDCLSLLSSLVEELHPYKAGHSADDTISVLIMNKESNTPVVGKMRTSC